ncbi:MULTISPECIES: NAD(P)-dependent oxidoreductase [Micrococcaceae]|uniref:NAD(P)-dependent oxidoreductase n=1 Tax=Micrococcaceae TaxID=1268 RepID=UPI0009EC7025|nr:NAD(P)-dependent oxidoreductase [Arthrobacter sp. Soil761]
MTTIDTGADTTRVGIVGLGHIGGGVATSLIRTGIAPKAVFDIRPEAAKRIEGCPVSEGSAADVANQSDVVILAVVTAEQAAEALFGAHGIGARQRDGLIVVLLSTIAVDSLHQLAERCAKQGIYLLDAAVTGGGRAASNGLIVMVGGPDEIVKRALPVLEGFARRVVHCGPTGAGMVAKLARNAITFGQWAVIHEAVSMAAAAGVTPRTLLDVLTDGTGDGTDPLNPLRRIVSGESNDPVQANAAHQLADKDLAAAQ